MKTSELSGAALDWAVGLANGWEMSLYGVDPSIRARVPGLGVHAPWRPTYYWSQGGPIIDQELIQINPKWHNHQCAVNPNWKERGYTAEFGWHWEAHLLGPENIDDPFTQDGGTALIAAMRCYVTSKLGEEVDIPQVLIK
jgi:hypothetical protein